MTCQGWKSLAQLNSYSVYWHFIVTQKRSLFLCCSFSYATPYNFDNIHLLLALKITLVAYLKSDFQFQRISVLLCCALPEILQLNPSSFFKTEHKCYLCCEVLLYDTGYSKGFGWTVSLMFTGFIVCHCCSQISLHQAWTTSILNFRASQSFC